MKTLACKDMGVNCEYIAKGKSDDEAVNAMFEHAEKSHMNEIKKMRETMDDKAIKDKMRGQVKEE